MQDIKTKRCSGCKCEKQLTNEFFYKNKLIVDGHSNYCIGCTKENSRKYFVRKKEKEQKLKIDDNNQLRFKLLNSLNEDPNNADNLMKILMLEKMGKSMLEEIEALKLNFVKNEN